MSNSAPSPDFSLRILGGLARWIAETKGRSELEKVAAAMGVRTEDFDGSTKWISHAQFETFVSHVYQLADNDDGAFREACSYRFKESYGAFRYMMWAISQQQMCEAAAKMTHKVLTNVGRFEVLRSERNACAVRYRSEVAESRLMCLSRQTHWMLGPTMWGLPQMDLTEHACIGRGDEYCEYHLRWFDRSSVLPIVTGIAVGGAFGLALWWSQILFISISPALPILGGLLGYVIELRRSGALNIRFANELQTVVRDLGTTEAETRTEIVALHNRQREWIQLMEQQVMDRTATLERVVDGLDSLQKSRVSTIRGFSHDLRNPLFVVRGNSQFLRQRISDGEESEALRDMEMAAEQIESMLSQLMEVATQDTSFVKLAPRTVDVAPLAETFRRRLKALVHGRDIKVSVFCTREAPDSVVIDPVVFDRVVDNLLTNAAKYTHTGSILLELSGTPQTIAFQSSGDMVTGGAFLTLKLSDTGEGIAPEHVERIFRPRAQNEVVQTRGYGIGLSSVVRLLAQIGGRLDVMSKPGVGTTFWAHFPVASIANAPSASDENIDSMIMRVVTIRKVENG